MRLSSDGLFYWDGAQWVSALSPDGRYRWDGTAWVALQRTFPSPAHPPRPASAPVRLAPSRPKAQRHPTPWTRPLQYAVAGAGALVAVWWIALAVVVAPQVAGAVDRWVSEQESLHPDQALPPPGYAASVSGSIWFGLSVIAIIAVALAVIVIVGALWRWGWIHYAALVLLALQGVGMPLAGLVQLPYGVSVPTPVRWGSAVVDAVCIALVGCMLIALLARGPWATRKDLSA